MSKITETIKQVQAAAEAVLDRCITSEEIIQVIEAIEVLVGAAPKAQQPVAEAKVEPAATITPAATTKRKYKKRRPYPMYPVNWSEHTEWLDLALNGGSHLFDTNRLSEMLVNKPQFECKLRKEGKLRGFKTVQFRWNARAHTVAIQAYK